MPYMRKRDVANMFRPIPRETRRQRRAERRGTVQSMPDPLREGMFPLEGGGSKQTVGNRRQPPVYRY